MVTTSDLHTAYLEAANNGPIGRYISPFRTDSEAASKVDRKGLKTMMKSMRLWKKTKQPSGHCTYKHKVTRIVIGFQGHVSSKKKMSTIYHEHATKICNLFQEHVNILGNTIFAYAKRNWKTEPDFNQSLVRYNNWIAAKA